MSGERKKDPRNDTLELVRELALEAGYDNALQDAIVASVGVALDMLVEDAIARAFRHYAGVPENG